MKPRKEPREEAARAEEPVAFRPGESAAGFLMAIALALPPGTLSAADPDWARLPPPAPPPAVAPAAIDAAGTAAKEPTTAAAVPSLGFIYPVFTAPDSGPAKTPYACSFHWFLAPDGRLLGLDVIRSDDTGRLALRAYVREADGAFRGWIYEAPVDQWEAFRLERKALSAGRNAIGRGDGWIAGSVRDAASGMDVAFDLDVVPETPGLGTSGLALGVLSLTATDYPAVRVKGWLTLQGRRMEIDSPGSASVHYGDRLPKAAYVATLPSAREDRLLLASARGDNLRIGGDVLGPGAFLYAYGSGAVPAVSFQVGDFRNPIDLGGGLRVRLENARVFAHKLLGVPTVTGTASAVLEKDDRGPWPGQWFRKTRTPLGTVLFDLRGDEYIEALRKKDISEAP